MADVEGDPAKQPPECGKKYGKCPHLKNTYEGMEGETYNCDVCGKRYKLYYEDMQ